MNKLLKYLTLAAAVAALTVTARATPTAKLTMSDGTPADTVTVYDNGPGDNFGTTLGAIDWSGNIGTWVLTVNVGKTNPVLGDISHPSMDLSFNSNATAAGTLWITFSDVFSGVAATTGHATVGGTMDNGSVTLNILQGAPSGLQIMTTGIVLGDPFSGSANGLIQAIPLAASPISTLTEQVVLVANGSEVVTGDARLTVPDGGTTALLLGAGLTGLALISRRQKRKS